MQTDHKYSFLEHILFPSFSLDEKKLRARVENKTVLITGASFGIGERLACKLAATGANVILVARTEEKLIALKNNIEQHGGKATIFPTDLTKPEQVQQLIDHLLLLPGIDIVINNAGKSIRRSINDSLDRYHDFTRTMGVNYLGPVQLMLALIPALQKSKGHIVNVSAINVLLAPAPLWSAYQASKSAFDNWFRCAAPELNLSGIRTSSVYLPLVRTRMIAPTAAYDKMPAMSPDHAANIVCRCIIKGSRKYAPWWLIFGQLASVLFGGLWVSLSTHYLKKRSPIC
jgi:short-subunit dehydrogenase